MNKGGLCGARLEQTRCKAVLTGQMLLMLFVLWVNSGLLGQVRKSMALFPYEEIPEKRQMFPCAESRSQEGSRSHF